MQGFLFDRPMPADQFGRVLAAARPAEPLEMV
jgi:EAL domain-containing protein (putative c-di-GMP-specific phosphodiesterase class I)